MFRYVKDIRWKEMRQRRHAWNTKIQRKYCVIFPTDGRMASFLPRNRLPRGNSFIPAFFVAHRLPSIGVLRTNSEAYYFVLSTFKRRTIEVALTANQLQKHG